MGNAHLNALLDEKKDYNCEVVAVCDVYRRRMKRAMERTGGEGYMDYRKLLDRKDIDAVFVVTPDHWHSKISIDAMDAGKHVYVEKPMTLTIEQAMELKKAVKHYDKVLQVGPGRTSDDKFWKARQIISEGRVGKVTWAQGGYNRNFRGGAFNIWFPVDPTAAPGKGGDDYVDWDMWLGHEWDLAPKIPWNPEHFFRFRKYWPYNGGVATDLLYHILAPLLMAITGHKGEYPTRVSANGGLYLLKDGRDIPDVFIMNADSPSEFTVNLVSVLTNNETVPARIYGQYATMDFSGDNLVLTGNGDYVDEFEKKNGGFSQVAVASDDRGDMQQNFFDVIRKGGQLNCDVNLGTATMVAIKMAVESYRQNKMMVWDAEKGEVKEG
jgi:predicted dehydrogenase